MKILQIDDSPQICEMFADMFIADRNSIISVNDGKEGLEMVIKNDYDLILLDIRMPNYSGIEFLQDLKNKRPSELKKIVVTSLLQFDQKQIKELMEFGIHSVEKKPSSFQQIKAIQESIYQDKKKSTTNFRSILIIDEQLENALRLSKFFTSSGFQTKVVADPLVGFKNIQEKKYDAILLDLDRQEYYGLKIIEMLAMMEILKNQNIFILPSRFGHNNKIKELVKRDGIKRILEGPLDPNEILEIITKDFDLQNQINLKSA